MNNWRDDYDAWHDQFPVDAGADTPWHDLVRERLVLERDIAGKRVLEIGCGRGGFACWLAGLPRPPLRLAGADFSPAAVQRARAFARERGVRGVQWEVEDIQRIGHPDGTFDTVISCETIEHVPDPPRAVREMARVLKSGGRLLLTTPNYLGSMGLYRIYARLRGRRYTEEGQPINQVTMLPRTIAWVKRAGLEVSAIDGVGHYLPIPGRAPIRLRSWDGARSFTRWLALHSLVEATKL
ncbi:MAG: methyltransferase domain-containing protein [Gemmatimonadetes bacterium]|nr:methyltransferase domain-containing protein [Gemmatimonadota bacterium]